VGIDFKSVSLIGHSVELFLVPFGTGPLGQSALLLSFARVAYSIADILKTAKKYGIEQPEQLPYDQLLSTKKRSKWVCPRANAIW
jgi:hypothetical protein